MVCLLEQCSEELTVGGLQQGRCCLWVMSWPAENVSLTLQASPSQGSGRHHAEQAPTASPLVVPSADGHLSSQLKMQSSAHGSSQPSTQVSLRGAASNLGAAIQAGEDEDEERAKERAIVIAEEPAGAISRALMSALHCNSWCGSCEEALLRSGQVHAAERMTA